MEKVILEWAGELFLLTHVVSHIPSTKGQENTVLGSTDGFKSEVQTFV